MDDARQPLQAVPVQGAGASLVQFSSIPGEMLRISDFAPNEYAPLVQPALNLLLNLFDGTWWTVLVIRKDFGGKKLFIYLVVISIMALALAWFFSMI